MATGTIGDETVGAARAHRRRRDVRTPLRTRRFVATLVGALLVTLTATAVLQLALGTRGVEAWFVAERLGVAVSDTRSMEAAFRGSEGTGEHFDQVHEAVRGLLGRPGVQGVAVLSQDGDLVLGATAGSVPAAWQDIAAEAATSGEPVGRSGDAAEGGVLYAVPIRLGDRAQVLVVAEDSSSLTRAEADLREAAMANVVGGLLLGAPLFFLAGGRSLLRAHRQVLDQSGSDGLTALGNHRSFQEELRREAALACREGGDLTLLLVDLDDFKLVNDRGGHRRGDQVLAAVADLLSSGRAADRAFRIGGDEFALLLPATTAEGGRLVGGRLRAAVEAADLGVTVSVGAAGLRGDDVDEPADASDPDALWACADAALYQAKRRGRNTVVTYGDLSDDAAEVVTPAKLTALHELLESRDVAAAFQPIWDLATDRPLGYEALARPRPGAAGGALTSPAEAFTVAWTAGRTGDLDEVCRAAVLARAHLLPEGTLLFLNLSPQSLSHPSVEPEELVRAVRAAGLAPERVVLEITERDIVRPALVARQTAALRRHGFRIALDDVGAGNAGLEMLRHVPVEYVKVDREIVVAAPGDQQARAVLLAVLAFARETGAFVIAEGIECDFELDFVRSVGERASTGSPAAVQGAQGYLLGRPAPEPAAVTPYAAVAVP